MKFHYVTEMADVIALGLLDKKVKHAKDLTKGLEPKK